ncbi:hypothetical protein HY406_01395 [Candidatus Giovannonibacteria bacterium]|nr:hypothetical protein [Candidatus Giovannonibacteria bacterium]
MFSKYLVWLFLVLGGCAFPSYDMKGRFVHRFTGGPLSNIQLAPAFISPDGKSAIHSHKSVYTDQAGEFSLPLPQTVKEGNQVAFLFVSQNNCYLSGSAWLERHAGGETWFSVSDNLGRIATTRFDTSGINIGDIPIWPAVDLEISSDIPIQVMVEYGNGGGQGGGNYALRHRVISAVPLNYPVRLRVTDQSGQVYRSVSSKLDLVQGCRPLAVRFQRGGTFLYK